MGSSELLSGLGAGAAEALEGISPVFGENLEAAVLETGREGLTAEQNEILRGYDEKIETEFRKLDMIEHMEEIDAAWRDGMNHSLQVDRIRMLISEMGDCAIQHADDPEFSALLMEKADQTKQILSDREHKRAEDLLKRLDKFEDDVLKRLHKR